MDTKEVCKRKTTTPLAQHLFPTQLVCSFSLPFHIRTTVFCFCDLNNCTKSHTITRNYLKRHFVRPNHYKRVRVASGEILRFICIMLYQSGFMFQLTQQHLTSDNTHFVNEQFARDASTPSHAIQHHPMPSNAIQSYQLLSEIVSQLTLK